MLTLSNSILHKSVLSCLTVAVRDMPPRWMPDLVDEKFHRGVAIFGGILGDFENRGGCVCDNPPRIHRVVKKFHSFLL